MLVNVHHQLPPQPGHAPVRVRLPRHRGYVVDTRDWGPALSGPEAEGTEPRACTVCALAHELVEVLERLSHTTEVFEVIIPWWLHIGRLRSTLTSHLEDVRIGRTVLHGSLDGLEDLLWSTDGLEESADCALTGHAELAAVAVEHASVLTARHVLGERTRELLIHLGCPAFGPAAEFLPAPAAGPMRVGLTGEGTHFVTRVVSAHGQLDAERFCRLLPEAAAGACRIRGTVWVDSRPETRVRVCGIGSQVWMEEDGQWFAPAFSSPSAVLACHYSSDPQVIDALCHWHPHHGDRCSRIALTAPREYAQDWAGLLAEAVRSQPALPDHLSQH